MCNNFPCFSVDGKLMQFVTEFKCEMRNMYIRTNTLLCRFGKCSKKVKVGYLGLTVYVCMVLHCRILIQLIV